MNAHTQTPAEATEPLTLVDVSTLNDGDCLRVPLTQVVDAPWGNSRRGPRDDAKTAEIRASIEKSGVHQSVTVRPNTHDNTVELLAGYGRRDLSLELGLPDIPVVIRVVGEEEARAIGLNENLHREDASLVDEIVFAQDFISLCNGDYEEAAKQLGWTVSKVKARLKLNDCSGTVLDALRNRTIGVGHAEVLSQFTEALQNGTLEKIIAEGWSVDLLKERAGKAVRLLRHAKFDTDDCKSCQYNSAFQSQLFENHVGADKCGNLVCFKEKSDAWVESRKAELEAEHGVVLIAREKPPEHRKTVSEAVVGAAYEADCLNCTDRVRILQDGINKDCGDVTDDQCVNLTCHKEKVAAKLADEQPEKAGKNGGKANGSAETKGAKTTKKPANKLLPAMKEQAEDYLRTLLGEQLASNETFQLAMTLYGVAKLTGYTIPGERSAATAQAITKLAGWAEKDLREHITLALRWGTADGERPQSFDGTGLAIKSAVHVPDALALATSQWAPTKEWLGKYQIGSIKSFCVNKAVAFNVHYDAANGKGSFEKLIKGKKAKIVDEILASDFDWSNVVPKEVSDLLK